MGYDGVELGGELRDLIYGKANRTLDIGIQYINEDGMNNLNVDKIDLYDSFEGKITFKTLDGKYIEA